MDSRNDPSSCFTALKIGSETICNDNMDYIRKKRQTMIVIQYMVNGKHRNKAWLIQSITIICKYEATLHDVRSLEYQISCKYVDILKHWKVCLDYGIIIFELVTLNFVVVVVS